MKPCIIRGADQTDVWLLTDHVKPLLKGEHTDNRLCIFRSQMHPKNGPPPHLHERDDEGFFILDGEVTFLAGDRLVRATAGQFVWAPRNKVHCFQCSSDGPAKMIVIVNPADFLNFAMTLAEPGPDFMQAPNIGPEKIGQLMSVAPQFGIRMMPEHPMPTEIVPAADASSHLWVMGEKVRILATAEQTGGQFTVIDAETAPQGGPPPHVHTDKDEIFYVIEGRHDILLGDKVEVIGPGDLAFIPRGTRHRFSCIGPERGRLLNLHTPGGFEKFFLEVGFDATVHATAPQTPPMSPEAKAALFSRHGMTA